MKKRNQNISIRTLKWLWLMIGITCVFVFHQYVLGNDLAAFYDAGSDTKDQYLMWYHYIVNRLRNGDFAAWDFTNGFGMNSLGHHLTDPFLMVVYLLGWIFGPEHLAYYMVYHQIVKIFCAGTAVYFYLSEFSYGERSKLFASYMYAFNAYLLVWGQHYALGTAVVFLPILLMYIERMIRRRKFSPGLCLISTVIICCSFYQGYMCMLIGGCYTCMRIWMQEKVTIRERWNAFWKTAGCMILGVLLAAFRLFPSAAAQVGSSGRLDSEQSLLQRIFEGNLMWSGDHYKTIIYRLFSSNIQGNGEDVYLGVRNYYEAPTLFFSTLFIILLCQYAVTVHRQSCSKKKKGLQYFSMLLCAMLVLIPAMTVPFNGFTGPFFRHLFVIMPFFAVLSAVALERILEEKKINLPALLLSVLAMAAVYRKAYTIFDEITYQDNALILCFTGIAMAGIFFAVCKKKADEKICALLLAVMLLVNVTADSHFDYSSRVTLKKDDPNYFSQTYHSDATEALAWLEEYDDSFYRVEKDYFVAASCMESQAQDYRGISTYNPNENEGVKKFIRQLWPQLYNENDRNHEQFQNAVWDHVMASITGVKYVLSKSAGFQVEGYQLIHQVGEIYIYENTNVDSIGTFYTKTVTNKQFKEYKKNLNTRAFLTDVLIVKGNTDYALKESEIQGYEKNVISDILAEGKWKDTYTCTAADGPVTWKFVLDSDKMEEFGSVTLECVLDVTARTEVKVVFDNAYEHVLVANKLNDKFTFSVPKDTQQITFTIEKPAGEITLQDIQFLGYEEEQTFSEKGEIHIDAPQKDTYLTGKISASEDGMAMLAIPKEQGWNVYLNGEEQTLYTGDYGFIAFEVKAGEYDLMVTYTAPLLKEGIMVSVGSLVLFLILIMFGKNRKEEIK